MCIAYTQKKCAYTKRQASINRGVAITIVVMRLCDSFVNCIGESRMLMNGANGERCSSACAHHARLVMFYAARHVHMRLHKHADDDVVDDDDDHGIRATCARVHNEMKRL